MTHELIIPCISPGSSPRGSVISLSTRNTDSTSSLSSLEDPLSSRSTNNSYSEEPTALEENEDCQVIHGVQVSRARAGLKYRPEICYCSFCLVDPRIGYVERREIIRALDTATRAGVTLAICEYPVGSIPNPTLEVELRSCGYAVTREKHRSSYCQCPGHESCRCHNTFIRLLIDFSIPVYPHRQIRK